MELPLGLITVHCCFCPAEVTDTDPVRAHDVMEIHYRTDHQDRIDQIVKENR